MTWTKKQKTFAIRDSLFYAFAIAAWAYLLHLFVQGIGSDALLITFDQPTLIFQILVLAIILALTVIMGLWRMLTTTDY